MDSHSSKNAQTWVLWLIKSILIVGFLVILGRLLDLQIIKGAYYKSLAEDNRVRRIPILAPRGSIRARNGETLAKSKEIDRVDDGMDSFDIIIKWNREYMAGFDFAHITGYLGQAKEGEVGKVRGDCQDKGTRKIGSYIGRTGLEEWYDCTLSGIDGEELIEVDAMGRRIRSLGVREPIPGGDLVTTIDYGLQRKIGQLMHDKKGAVVAMDTNGEILALFSSPSFDPSIFVSNDKSQNTARVLTDTNLPLFNRAIGGLFHPGSIYKPLVAVSALQEGTIDSQYTYEDTGRITINSNYGNFTYNNWYFTQYGGKEGKINVVRALARSTDTFFYELGNLLGVEKLDSWSHTFNLDEKTGIDLPGEIAGVVPSPEWKMKLNGERWFLGNTYHMAIGQGDLSITPLAITSAISAIANNGEWCKPQLVGGTDCKRIALDQKNIDIVKQGMHEACSPGGTAFPFFDFEIPSACKTGTAQIDTGDDTHAWFTIFSPKENPEIVLTVLVEKGGEGSKVAAPIARDILNYWFYERKGLEVPKKVSPSAVPTHFAVE